MKVFKLRTTTTIVLVATAMIALLGFLTSYEIERYYMDRVTSSLKTRADVVLALVEEAEGSREPRLEASRNLGAVALASEMRITLIDSAGVVLYDSAVPDSLLVTLQNHRTRPEIVEAMRKGIGTNVRLSASVHHEQMYAARLAAESIHQDGPFANLAIVRVSIDLSDVEAVINEMRFKIAISCFAVFIVVLLIARYWSRRISQPLAEIGEMVKEIKSGNLDQRLPVRSNDELGVLADLVNQLSEKLKADIEQLQKLESVRSQFLANVSHELRTPIFSLKGFLETLLDGAVNDPTVNLKFVEKAYHHANRLDALLTDLIEISRIESGEMKMSFRYFDASALLKQVVQDSSDQATKKNQHLTLDVPEKEISVLGDRDRLRQAITNLLDNALKYSPPGSSITARLSFHDAVATIAISDNGPGIEAEHLPRIFERFYRVDKNRSREVGGTGLGLAIVKHIVEAHGGKVVVTSEVGKGTTFAFDLRT